MPGTVPERSEDYIQNHKTFHYTSAGISVADQSEASSTDQPASTLYKWRALIGLLSCGPSLLCSIRTRGHDMTPRGLSISRQTNFFCVNKSIVATIFEFLPSETLEPMLSQDKEAKKYQSPNQEKIVFIRVYITHL